MPCALDMGGEPALALGAGSKSRAPMGMAVIGGLIFSLGLTLFVIPAMYTYLSKKHVHKDQEFSNDGIAIKKELAETTH